MTNDWLLRLFGADPSVRRGVFADDESYAVSLLLGDAKPPADYMRNRKLDEALDRYRQALEKVRRRDKVRQK